MANSRYSKKETGARLRWSPLLASCLLAGLVLGGCKPETVPTDSDLLKAYLDNHKEFDNVARVLEAQPNQDFDIQRNKGVDYHGSSNPPVTANAVAVAQQIMRRTFCLDVKRKAGTLYFIFHEHNSPDLFRRKALVYDRDAFADPSWKPSVGAESNVRYAPLPVPATPKPDPNPHWTIEYKYEKH